VSRVRKTREQLANEFFVSVSEIGRLFGIDSTVSKACFEECKRAETNEFNFNQKNKVRLETVLKVLQISDAELRKKIKDPS